MLPNNCTTSLRVSCSIRSYFLVHENHKTFACICSTIKDEKRFSSEGLPTKMYGTRWRMGSSTKQCSEAKRGACVPDRQPLPTAATKTEQSFSAHSPQENDKDNHPVSLRHPPLRWLPCGHIVCHHPSIVSIIKFL